MLDIAQDFPMLRNLRSENCRFVYLDNAATTEAGLCSKCADRMVLLEECKSPQRDLQFVESCHRAL